MARRVLNPAACGSLFQDNDPRNNLLRSAAGLTQVQRMEPRARQPSTVPIARTVAATTLSASARVRQKGGA